MLIETTDWIPVVEAAKQLNLSRHTLTSYISRKQIIPQEYILRMGPSTFIHKDWIAARKQANKKGR